MEKRQIVETLLEITKLLEIEGANPFRIRAYENAARALRGTTDDIGDRVEAGTLSELQGIGKGLAEAIETLYRTGTLELHRELKESFPPGVLELAQIDGLGAKRLRVLVKEEGIATPESLEDACLEGRVAELPGFGEKTQANILRSLEELARYRERHLLSDALRLADRLRDHLAESGWTAHVAGSVRRARETVGDLDFVLAVPGEEREEVAEQLQSHPEVERTVAAGETKVTIRVVGGWQVDFRLVEDEELPSALHHFTGSKEHNIQIRGRAKDRGLLVNEYGLFRGEERLSLEDEEDLFRVLDLAFVPPELREGDGEIEAAEQGAIPVLVEVGDCRGTFHVHTDWSDGTASLRVMAEAARDRGWEYLGIADHSRAAGYAGGLSPEELREQGRAIRELNRGWDDFRLFHGVECDILVDGRLDLPDEILSELDYVVVSVHSRLDLPGPEMTRRVTEALENPYVTMLGHPTGRLLLRREASELDLDAVLARAEALGVLVEVNASPRRLDLDWRHLRGWLRAGNLTSINPDAHDPSSLDFVRYGVAVARKAWATPGEILNCLPLAKVEEFLRDHRRRRVEGSE
ncbi:MAG: DNA polymerase/3'-5' exonuclease PolX [Thermoanaerobaculia bacterium]|nr:DNA polymerase/3'-5' exonuclease PolX [Thermoanaerobaculia bacterium]